jgi:tetratricopeptide (TPR) repeat protein
MTAIRTWAANRASFLRAWAIAVTLGVMACILASNAYRGLPRPRPLEELSYYPSGQYLKPASLGHAETAADLAWIRAVQYYGEHRRTDNRFTRMSHVFDILTSLSPAFVPAYVFGAFALAQEGRNFPAAERLMLKGLDANPQSGLLAFQLGFLYYVRPGGRSLNQAAQYFEQSARQPDGPPNAARFAAFARQHSGNLRVAYELWAQVYQNSPNVYLRATAEREMEKIRMALAQGNKKLAMRHLTTPEVVIKKE